LLAKNRYRKSIPDSLCPESITSEVVHIKIEEAATASRKRAGRQDVLAEIASSAKSEEHVVGAEKSRAACVHIESEKESSSNQFPFDLIAERASWINSWRVVCLGKISTGQTDAKVEAVRRYIDHRLSLCAILSRPNDKLAR